MPSITELGLNLATERLKYSTKREKQMHSAACLIPGKRGYFEKGCHG